LYSVQGKRKETSICLKFITNFKINKINYILRILQIFSVSILIAPIIKLHEKQFIQSNTNLKEFNFVGFIE